MNADDTRLPPESSSARTGSSSTGAEPVPPADGHPRVGLETEPVPFFHPLLAGRASPGSVQPVPGALLLEEEPATWPQFAP